MAAKRRRVVYRRSGLEDRVADDLKNRGIGFTYETTTYPVVVPVATRGLTCQNCGHTKADRATRYTPDFFLDNGVIVEAKGRLTADNRRTYEAFVKQYPELDWRMLIQRDQPIRKGSKTKYSDWCISLGVPYHIGERIPDEWCEAP